ncbi:MAG: SNF2 helicase associated domain-containing protein [Clostridia bacterium]|nr:SNF2 helicase associated domain-containing protein [Clostridia bacterium]
MYTRADIVRAVSSEALASQGSALQTTGCVRKMSRVEHKGYTRYFGIVRDAQAIRMAAFSYAPDEKRISGLSCDCEQGKRSRGCCQHTAALLFEALAQDAPQALQEEAAESRLGAFRSVIARRREQARLEQMRLEEEEAMARRAEVDAIIGQARMGGRAAGTNTEKTALHPVLSLHKDGLKLQLRIGAKKLYAVRNMKEFAQRCELRQSAVYGKELTFSHCEEDVREEDAALLWQIVAAAQRRTDGAHVVLTGAQLDQMMRLLIGREVEWSAGDAKTVRVRVEAGSRPLDVQMEQSGGAYRLKVAAQHVVKGTAGAYFILPEEGEILCAFAGAFERISPLLRLAGAFPEGATLEGDQLGAACAGLIAPAAKMLNIVSGEEIVREHTPMQLMTRFYIDMDGEQAITCRVVFDYGAAALSPGEENPHIRRDEAAEADALGAVRQLFSGERETGEFVFEGDDDACFKLLEQDLASLERCGEVMIAEKITQMNVKRPAVMNMGVSVSEAGMLVVKADLGGLSQEDLQAAYLAYRLKKKYVRLPGGAFLSGEALEQAADAAKTLESIDVTAEQAQEGTQVPMNRAMYLNEALKERKSIKLSAPKAVTDWVARIEQAQKTSAANPQTLKATLRDYQLEGLSWLTAISDAGFGGILADDMGLGKTMQALALLLSCKERGETVRAMVVCPASLQLNWDNEAEKFAPSLSACALMGNAKAREEQVKQENELLITSYDQLRRDVMMYKDITFTHIFLDEAQNIKNAASQAAKAVKTLKAEHRFAMTGTPIENRLSELWSIFDFLMPGYLLAYKKFKEKFETPIVKENDEKALESLRMMTAPFILRRMKADVLDDLPEKTEKIMTSEMTPEQKKLYHAHAAQLIEQSEGGFADQTDRFRILAGLTRLRQLCCDPRLCLEGYAGSSGKLTQCIELVREMIAGGHRILLFSQFTSMLDILRNELETQGVTTFSLTGDTDKEERMELVRRFNAGDAQVFLISLKAGGTGLNLTGADVVIHYDPWWNTSAQSQATDRAYRIGQKRGVQVIKLIADNTIEARILKLQQRKSALSDGVLSGDENLFTMDAQALKSLL